MSSWKDGQDSTPKVVLILSALILLGSIGFALLAPAPQTTSATKRTQTQNKIKADTKATEDETKDLTAKVDARIWTMGPIEVGPAAMTQINDAAKKHNVKVSGFRPQRVATAASLTQMPFQITVLGHFPDVVALANELESGASKLGVTQLILTNADGLSDNVNGTIGFVAYAREPKAENK